MPKLDIQNLRDMSEGVIQGVDEAIVPQNSVYLAVNLLFDSNLGRAVLRDGMTQIGSQIESGKSCLGLHSHIETDGTNIPLAVFNAADDNSSVISEYSGGSWSNSDTGWAADTKIRFLTFLDNTLAVNGTTEKSFDGSSWATTGGAFDVSNIPVIKYPIEFHDRVYGAGVSSEPDRLYYSGVQSSGSVSWTSGNGNIDIEPEEGTGPITGLAKVPNYLLIFKERSMKRWDDYSTYPESLVNIGTLSQDSIVQTNQSVYFFNKRGIYQTTGKTPQKISRRVSDIIDAIPSSYYDSVSGWGDGEYIYFSIGDIALDGLTLNNCVLTRHIDNQVWTLLSFSKELVMWDRYITGNDERIMAGDTDGNVWQVLQGNQDGSSNIDWLLQYHTQEFGYRSRLKDINKINVFTKNVVGGRVSVRTKEDGDFQSFGEINEEIQEATEYIGGNWFDFRIQGTGYGDIQVVGIEFPETDINLSSKP